ncbi:hypothetical protein GYMLUDRAFT_911160 [Collybiopsis luxurians FD-317 M1]|nr:hypothetical protein GYMLUDRAFT_911160 [Collybiopsis luxurians FD-317 M1]
MFVSASSKPDHIPQELADVIIGFLYDDKAALFCCSLVCRAWMPTTRYHLFRCLQLKQAITHHRPTAQNGASFLDLVLSPHNTIVPYINTLSLNAQQPWFEDILRAISGAPLINLSMKTHTRPWEKPSSLMWLADAFPNLIELAVSPYFFLDGEMLRLPTYFQTLRSLSLTPSPNAERESVLVPTEIAFSNLDRLDSLCLSTDATLDWFGSLVPIGWSPRLRTLHITLYRCYHRGVGSVNQINLLLAASCDTLDHFGINIEYRNEVHDREDSPDGWQFVMHLLRYMTLHNWSMLQFMRYLGPFKVSIPRRSPVPKIEFGREWTRL